MENQQNFIINKTLLEEASQVVKDFIKIAVPQILFISCLFIQGSLNLFYVSHTYKDADMLNAVGIANLYVNLTTSIIIFGIIGGLDTLASNAYGAKNYLLLGIYFDRCRYICLTYNICILLLDFLFARSILGLLKVEERVIDYVLEYVHIYVFSFFFQIDFQINIKYFVLIEKTQYNLIISACSLFFHAIVCGTLVCIFNLGVRGASIATTLTALFNMATSIYFIHSQGLPKESLVYFTMDGLREWWAYLKIAIPGTIISGGEWLGYELQGLAALFISSPIYSTCIITMNLEALTFPLTAGISTAVSLKAGERLTSEESKGLKKYILICYGLSFVMVLIGIFIVGVLGNYFFYAMSPNDEIYQNCIRAKPIIYIYIFGVNLFYFYLGVLKAIGYLRNPTIVSFILFYFVELSLTYLFAFKLNMKVNGIWTSLTTGRSIGGVLFTYWTYSFDMEEMKQKALARVDNDNKNLLSIELTTGVSDNPGEVKNRLLEN